MFFYSSQIRFLNYIDILCILVVARRASNFSLRQRCAQYINDSRPKVADMMSCWGKELYLFYLPIKDSDDFIDQVERELIRVIIPPCNSNIPDHYILPEEKMF